MRAFFSIEILSKELEKNFFMNWTIRFIVTSCDNLNHRVINGGTPQTTPITNMDYLELT